MEGAGKVLCLLGRKVRGGFALIVAGMLELAKHVRKRKAVLDLVLVSRNVGVAMLTSKMTNLRARTIFLGCGELY